MKFSNCVRYAFLVCASLFMLVGCNFSASSFRKKAGGLTFIQKDSTHYRIMAKGVTSEQAMLKYLLQYNRKISPKKAAYIVRTYIWESAYEGVNYDVAFIQMCHETGFLHFKGAVSPVQNNFCGLGTLSDSTVGLFFPDVKTGIRAHIQHLKAYASSQDLRNRCVDPRFVLIRRNSANDIFELTGKWATDRNYGNLIRKKIDDLIDMENSFRQKKQSEAKPKEGSESK